jgi:hypothetical protein
VAAVTGPTGWDDGSWVAAFLVLVTGVGQIGLGVGRASLAPAPPTRRRLAAELATLNAAAILVIGGTLATAPTAVTIGSVAFAAAVVAIAWGARRRRAERWTCLSAVFTALLVILLVSTPVGIALAWIRA